MLTFGLRVVTTARRDTSPVLLSINLCALVNLTDLDADAAESLDKNPPFVVKEKTSLFVNKIELSNTVKLNIKRALRKSSAVNLYVESSTKSFIV